MSGRSGSLLVIAGLLAVTTFAGASGDEQHQVVLDFTKGEDSASRIRWSHADRLNRTEAGLGYAGEQNSCYDAWIETSEPIAVGMSWRPPTNAGITVVVDRDWSWPSPTGMVRAFGRLYVRYGPDGEHWSSWQELPGRQDSDPEGGRSHAGRISVPTRERAAYVARLREYAARDVPWKSDEEAACRWIVEKDPKFFVKNNPFIGYVQFLYETSVYGGHRIRGMKASFVSVYPGPSARPRVESVAEGRWRKRWRFRGESEAGVERLDWTHVRDDGRLHVAAGAADRELDLHGTRITDDGLAPIATVTELRSLNLSGTGITGNGLRHLAGLIRLERLDLSRTRNVDGGLVHLKALVNLKVLDLKSAGVTSAGVAHLAALTSLEDLDLLGARLRPQDLTEIGKLTALRRLCLWSCRVTDEGLAHLRGLTRLRSLTLNGRITDAGLAHLEPLVELEELGITRTGATDTTLARLGRMPQLRRLALSGTCITDDGLVHLAKLVELERLWIDGTPVTDVGLAHLSGLKRLTSLRLHGTRVTDAGLAHLEGLTDLEELTVSDTDITKEAVEKLKARLTKLRTVW